MYYRVAIDNETNNSNFYHLLKSLNYVTGIEQEYVHNIISTPEKIYKLKFPLHSVIYKEQGMTYIKEEITNTIGVGIFFGEALNDFSDEFDFAYKNYTSKDNTELTNDALFLKYFLNSIVIK